MDYTESDCKRGQTAMRQPGPRIMYHNLSLPPTETPGGNDEMSNDECLMTNGMVRAISDFVIRASLDIRH